jgi:hypothetical protein
MTKPKASVAGSTEGQEGEGTPGAGSTKGEEGGGTSGAGSVDIEVIGGGSGGSDGPFTNAGERPPFVVRRPSHEDWTRSALALILVCGLVLLACGSTFLAWYIATDLQGFLQAIPIMFGPLSTIAGAAVAYYFATKKQ